MRYVHGNRDERHRIDIRRLMKSVLLEAKLETRVILYGSSPCANTGIVRLD